MYAGKGPLFVSESECKFVRCFDVRVFVRVCQQLYESGILLFDFMAYCFKGYFAALHDVSGDKDAGYFAQNRRGHTIPRLKNVLTALSE